MVYLANFPNLKGPRVPSQNCKKKIPAVTVASLPVNQKPLRKGYNFFKSGHVSEVKFNKVEDIVHVNATVLSSYKSKSYRTDSYALANATRRLIG